MYWSFWIRKKAEKLSNLVWGEKSHTDIVKSFGAFEQAPVFIALQIPTKTGNVHPFCSLQHAAADNCSVSIADFNY